MNFFWDFRFWEIDTSDIECGFVLGFLEFLKFWSFEFFFEILDFGKLTHPPAMPTNTPLSHPHDVSWSSSTNFKLYWTLDFEFFALLLLPPVTQWHIGGRGTQKYQQSVYLTIGSCPTLLVETNLFRQNFGLSIATSSR